MYFYINNVFTFNFFSLKKIIKIYILLNYNLNSLLYCNIHNNLYTMSSLVGNPYYPTPPNDPNGIIDLITAQSYIDGRLRVSRNRIIYLRSLERIAIFNDIINKLAQISTMVASSSTDFQTMRILGWAIDNSIASIIYATNEPQF